MTDKRPYGTGTVTRYKLKNDERWRIRLPGRDRKEYCGFVSKESAEKALERALSGLEMPRSKHWRPTKRDLYALINKAHKLAARLGVPLEIRT